jgi:D-sedoheptulose 7-phosphate isomerase
VSSFENALDETLRVIDSLRNLGPALQRAAVLCTACLQSGGKLLICGNGGSAAEAMHLTGELVGRYKSERNPLAAITLGIDPVVTTCIGNDYRYQETFSRPFKALARAGDVLIAFSTSGESLNVIEVMQAANAIGIASIAFLGRDGSAARKLATEALVVRHSDTARIQEGHQFLIHSLMDLLDIPHCSEER